MQKYRVILIIGIIEILIGAVTIFTNIVLLALSANHKNPGILFFVIVAGCCSTLFGIGILKFKKIAYQLLLYFSSVILLSKGLILAGILELNDAFKTGIPDYFRSALSLSYHGFVIYYLLKSDIKQIFH